MNARVWQKAYKIARLEARLSFLQIQLTSPAADPIIRTAVDLVQESINEALSDPENAKILEVLPLAKEYVSQVSSRDDALGKTLVGLITSLLDNWGAMIDDRVHDLGGRGFIESLGIDADDAEILDELARAIPKRSQKKIVNILRRILGSIKINLIYSDLPPTPNLPELDD